MYERCNTRKPMFSMNRYTHHHTAETIMSLYSAHDLCQRIHTAHKDALSPLNTVFSEGFSQHTTWHTVFLYSCTSAYSLYLAATDWFLYWITWKVKQVKFCNSAEKTSVVVILQFCLYLPFLSYNKCYDSSQFRADQRNKSCSSFP